MSDNTAAAPTTTEAPATIQTVAPFPASVTVTRNGISVTFKASEAERVRKGVKNIMPRADFTGIGANDLVRFFGNNSKGESIAFDILKSALNEIAIGAWRGLENTAKFLEKLTAVDLVLEKELSPLSAAKKALAAAKEAYEKFAARVAELKKNPTEFAAKKAALVDEKNRLVNDYKAAQALVDKLTQDALLASTEL